MPAFRDRPSRALYMRDYRRRKREAREAASREAAPVTRAPLADPVGALAAWARETLIVPPGHPLAGEPMALPPFAEDFLRASWGAHESALSMSRKNGKSAICAVLCLGFLVGPLRTPGWRGAVASVSKEKGIIKIT